MWVAIVLTVLSAPAFGQTSGATEPDIRRRLELIEKGQADAVKAELPALLTTYQNDPGVLYLQAVLTSDGTEAAKLYQNIVDNFPKSEWADDALYRLYQYYYAIGLYKTAEQKLMQLKEQYPFSAYATEEMPSGGRKTVAEEKPATTKPRGKVQKYASGFTIQVGAFSTMQNAEDLKARFEKEGYSANIFTKELNGTKLYKVWVGEFQTYDEARRFTGEVKKKFNLASMVVSR
jgi:tetratricopeptide (TPR) repeat protein